MEKRSQEEMMALIIDFAKIHSEIVMIGMEGSRNNSDVTVDDFQDYDVTYFVNKSQELKRLSEADWTSYFGKTIVTQTLHENFLEADNPDRHGYTHMMLFEDENRIDLKILLVSDVKDYLASDSLNTIIWGGESRETSDETHQIKPPTNEELDECINEFYWVSAYVVKGLMRNQLLYASSHLELIRTELFKLMDWYYFAGENPGKNSWGLQEFVPDITTRYYNLSTTENMWNTLIEMEETFERYMGLLDVKKPEFVVRTKDYIHKYYKQYLESK